MSNNDDIYLVGDFAYNPLYRSAGKQAEDKTIESFSVVLEQLKGRIHWIYGNHDPHKNKRVISALKQYFVWTGRILDINVRDESLEKKNQKIVLCHFPFMEWEGKDNKYSPSWHLHGHMHGKMPDDSTRLMMDIGVDCNNYTPVSYDQVKEHMNKKQYVPSQEKIPD